MKEISIVDIANELKYMKHQFSVRVANNYGLHEAIVLQVVASQSFVAKQRGTEAVKGLYHTGRDLEWLCRTLKYIAPWEVADALYRLENAGLVKTFGDEYLFVKDFTVTAAGVEIMGGSYDDFSRVEKPILERKDPSKLPKKKKV